MARCHLVSARETPEAPAKETTARCPRCGGASRPHKRQRAFGNPFLPKAKSEITCEDCGLDFDPAEVEAARASGQSRWGKG